MNKKVQKTLEQTEQSKKQFQVQHDYQAYLKRLQIETNDLIAKNDWLQAKKTNQELNNWYYTEKKLELNIIKTVVDDLIKTYSLEDKKDEIYKKNGLQELETLLEKKDE